MSLSPFVTSSSSVAALSSNRSTPSIQTAANATPRASSKQEKYSKIVEKVLSDLEALGKQLIRISRREHLDDEDEPNEYFSDENDSGETITIRDDCYELQKFCFKLEFLLQFELKEKKSAGFLSQPSTPSTAGQLSPDVGLSMSACLKREYWSFMNDALKSSRSFQDAIKYAKGINEIKTPLGKARAFIRFCLQYHRLADAVQQLMMEEKVVSNWYLDKAIWHKEAYKTRVIQLLYDLSDVKFDLISKNNFELDTTWPTIELQNNKKYQTNKSKQSRLGRTRENSISSYISTTTISINPDASNANAHHTTHGGDNSLLSSTPLEMEDDFLFSASMNQNKSILYDKTNSNDDQRSLMANDIEHSSYWTNQIEQLREELNAKSKRNEELSECLLKQTNFCENLSALLRKSDDKNKELESKLEKSNAEFTKLEADNSKLKEELESTKLELGKKPTDGGDLAKELIDQKKELEKLRDESAQQQILIKQLQHELNVIKQERENEIDTQEHQLKHDKIQLQLKEEEIYLLNDQIQKLSRSLDNEQKQNSFLATEIAELKEFYKNLNEKNSALIAQLEADNTEIKKRLVKLIKEKAELWQKADNLEYENLLKNNAMWMDDSNVSNCMSCNNTFSLMLRKHHCRICLKIYCYYCCNCWIEYNNSKLRVCKKCFDLKTNPSQVDVISSDSTTTAVATGNDQISPPLSDKPQSNDYDEEDEDDKLDVNFEVRPEKLNSNSNDSFADDIYANTAYARAENQTDDSKQSATDDVKPSTTGIDQVDQPATSSSSMVSSSLSSSSKLIKIFNDKVLKNKFDFKFFDSSDTTSQATSAAANETHEDQVVVERKRITRKKPPAGADLLAAVNSNEDSDAFSIVSQDEIDRIK